MKKIVSCILGIAVIIIILSTKSNAASSTATMKVTVKENYTYAYNVLKLVNIEREIQGVPKLTMDKELLDAAMLRASELVIYYSHTRPNGKTPGTTCGKVYAENIAAFSKIPRSTVEGWMCSSSHRKTMLSKEYISTGIGVVECDGNLYWVQLFGKNRLNKITKQSEDRTVTKSITALTNKLKLAYKGDTEFNYDIVKENKTDITTQNLGVPKVQIKILSNDLKYQSSNEKILKVNSNGTMDFLSSGEVKLKVSLKSNSQVYIEQKIKIKRANYIPDLSITGIKDYIYTGKNIEPKIILKDDKYILEKNKDYEITYYNNKNIGTSTVNIKGIGKYKGEVKKTFKIIPNKTNGVKVSSKSTSTLTIKYNKVQNVSGYVIYKYNPNSKTYKYYGKTKNTTYKISKLKAGTIYKIKVKAYKTVGKTDYYGEYSQILTAITTPNKVTKLKTKSKTRNKLNITWKKVSNASGYKVYVYNTNKKKYDVYTAKKNSISIKNLRAGKKYKIKVRAYRKSGKICSYGNYSSILKVKTKK